ncbi:MAG: formylglycine-generating enzyme family protein [Verrucomicrobiales bacterium]|nr:formylglycine-generating enzyme family protein [Verrucomicrobiales bacterium]
MKTILCLLLLTFGLLMPVIQSSAQSASNSLQLENNGPLLRLRYSLADTNGVFFLLQSSQITNLIGTGKVLASGAAVSNRTGVLDLPRPTNSPVFFALLQDSSALINPIPLPNFVKIPAGTFLMGSPTTKKERNSDETQHTVLLTRDFYMSKYEVTQEEYLAVMGNNPSFATGDLTRPVESMNWYDATAYCAELTASEGAAGRLPAGWVYRLPTESEWEYACRAGTSTPFHYGPDLRSGMANFDGGSEYLGGTGTVNNPNGTYLDETAAVGSYAPNAFGLYDMHGNVWELCLDWYGSYPSGTVTNPLGPAMGSFRVGRGGGWDYDARRCRSAYRFFRAPDGGGRLLGFRPVLAPGQ